LIELKTEADKLAAAQSINLSIIGFHFSKCKNFRDYLVMLGLAEYKETKPEEVRANTKRIIDNLRRNKK